MKVSERWLREWVDPPVDVEQLCDQLTSAGLEVESHESITSARLEAVVGEVLSIDVHPAADRLRICLVADGEATRQVVCGASNVRIGMKAAYAKPGILLPGSQRAVGKAEIRGVESSGMLCSAKELGLGDDCEGLLDLGPESETGACLHELLQLYDHVINVDLTPNRGDCFSVLGIARELGAVNGMPLDQPRHPRVAAESEVEVPIELGAPVACPRYLGRVIEDVDNTRGAPVWMVERLRRSGIRTINPLVDIANYVMLELGQPLHAFDLSKLTGGISICLGHERETLRVLDESEVRAQSSDLLICDGSGPVALAGIIGGAATAVSETTDSVFLECAYFDPLTIARTARRLGLQTDASIRYERGVDFELPRRATERYTSLVLEILGGQPGPVVEALQTEFLPRRRTVELRRSRLNRVAGEMIEPSAVTSAFERLGFAPKIVGGSWQVEAPSYRFDIEIEEDLIEEACRMVGYNSIGNSAPQTRLRPGHVAKKRRSRDDIRDQLAAMGFQETISYSFVSTDVNAILDPGASVPRLSNPMSEERPAMRSTLWSGLLEALRFNVSRQATGARLFEIGQCFRHSDQGLLQQEKMGLVLWGDRSPANWGLSRATADFFDLKGAVEALLLSGGRAGQFDRVDDPSLHPGQSAQLRIDGECAGRLGRIHPTVAATLDVPEETVLFEGELEYLLRTAPRCAQELSRFPSVRRDIACVVPEGVSAAEVERVVRAALGSVLQDFSVFDVYSDQSIGPGSKSIAIRLTMQHFDDTLADFEILELVENARSALEAKLAAGFR